VDARCGRWRARRGAGRRFDRDLWQPAASTDLITTHPGGLPAAASTATTDATEPTDATIGTHRPYDGNAAGLGDLTADDEFASSKANYRTDAEVFPGTLVKFRTPAEFATPWGTLMVAVCGWNDLVRLTARFGFDEAWRMLEQR
jgi:hypothetical protein